MVQGRKETDRKGGGRIKGRGTEKEGQRQEDRIADRRRAVFLTWLRMSGLELSPCLPLGALTVVSMVYQGR